MPPVPVARSRKNFSSSMPYKPPVEQEIEGLRRAYNSIAKPRHSMLRGSGDSYNPVLEDLIEKIKSGGKLTYEENKLYLLLLDTMYPRKIVNPLKKNNSANRFSDAHGHQLEHERQQAQHDNKQDIEALIANIIEDPDIYYKLADTQKYKLDAYAHSQHLSFTNFPDYLKDTSYGLGYTGINLSKPHMTGGSAFSFTRLFSTSRKQKSGSKRKSSSSRKSKRTQKRC